MEIINQSKAGAGRRTAVAPLPQSEAEQLRLERVYGSGSCAAGTVSCSHPVVPGLLAYSSGSIVVLYDSLHKQQNAFFAPRSRRSCSAGKPYACLAFSRDGAYLAAGERGDQSPAILVWEVSSSRCLQVLKGHKHGISSVNFSQDGRLLVSSGESYDGQLCVWDWQAGTLLAKQHTQGDVARACVSEESAANATITTVGKSGHFKVWTLALPTGRSGSASLTARPVNLKEYRTSSFVGVVAAPGAPALLYALTSAGVLLTVTVRPSSRSLDKSVNLQVPAAFALAASSKLVACGCAAGVVRLFEARSLAFKGNLPRHSARSSGPNAPEGAAAATGPLFPDALAVAFDCDGERLTVAYADRSLLVWDVRNPSKVIRARSVLSHSGIIWSTALIPAWQASLLAAQASAPTPGGGSDIGAAAGPSSVLCTCGADGTVRLWNVCLDNTASTAGPMGVPADAAGAAKVTRTLRAVIHVTGPAEPVAPAGGPRRFAPDAPLPGPGGSAASATAAKPVTLRCLRVSPCGRHLATGDSRGNLRVFSLASLQLLLHREAHDAEILSLDYSPPSLDGTCYLASGSRDALVHVYDMSRGYELVGTCDAHGGPVTAVRFSSNTGTRMALLSCSADKSVVFRRVQLGQGGLSFQVYHTERMSRGVLYDLAVDPGGGRAVAVGQDGQVRTFDVATGRAIRNFAGDPACGEAVSVQMDPTGSLAVCSCADGSVAVYDLDAGTLLARGAGHSEVCTGAVLLEDHRGLVTVGGDGCALLWRLAPGLARRMQEAAAQVRRHLEAQVAAQEAAARQREEQERRLQEATPALPRRKAWGVGEAADGDPQQVHIDLSATMMRLRENKPLLSIDKLPKWAQKLYGREDDLAVNGGGVAAAAPEPAGKWALRMAAPEQPPAAAPPTAPVAATAGAIAPPAPSALPPQQQPQQQPVAACSSGLEHREWAVLVEEEDEILYCDPEEEEEGGLVLQGGGPGGFAVQQIGDAEAASGSGSGLVGANVAEEEARLPSKAHSPERGSGAGVAGRYQQAVGEAVDEQEGAAEEEELQEPASGCASNCVGGSAPEAAKEDDFAGKDGVRRDLFKEHFDSLGLDQGSATKPPDPRRQSLSLLYRKARAVGSSGVRGGGAASVAAAVAAAPISPPRLAPAAAVAVPPPAGGAVPAGAATPPLARMLLPAGITATRGAATAEVELDGAVTSAAWTPERAMLPLTSPALANTDKQLMELERMRQRLASTLRKRPGVGEPAQAPAPAAANGPGPAAPAAAAPAVTGAVPAAAAAVAPQAAAAQIGGGPEGGRTMAPGAPDLPAMAQQQAAAVAGTAPQPLQLQPEVGAQPSSATQPSNSGITFAPPPVAAANPGVGTAVAAASGIPQAGGQAPLAAAGPPPTPGFSTLSDGTPWLGRQPAPASAATPAAPYQNAGSAHPHGIAAPAEGILMYNPIYGATPGTPVLGLAVAKPLGGAPGAAAIDAGPRLSDIASAAVPVSAAAQAAQVGNAAAPVAPACSSVVGGAIAAALQPQDDGFLYPTGVCVVRRDSGDSAGSKAQQGPQPKVATAHEGPVSAGTSGQSSPTAVASPSRRRPKVELPAIRGSPSKAAVAEAQEPAAAAQAAAAPTQVPYVAGAQGAAAATAAAALPSDAACGAHAEILSRMQGALRDFASAFRQLQFAPPAAAHAGEVSSGAAALLAHRYRAAAEGAVTELSTLLSGRGLAPACGTGPTAPGLPATCGQDEGSSAPAVVACASPRVSAQNARLGQRRPDVIDGSSGGAAVAAAASASVGSGLASSQVVLEVGLVESMVEEKVQQRMREELRKVEESIMQRIMQSMQTQAQHTQ